jgi:hypothetical protein
VVDEGKSKRPSSAVTHVNTDKAEKLLKEERILSFKFKFKCVIGNGSSYSYSGIRHE